MAPRSSQQRAGRALAGRAKAGALLEGGLEGCNGLRVFPQCQPDVAALHPAVQSAAVQIY